MTLGENNHHEVISRVIERSASITELNHLSALLCEEVVSAVKAVVLAAVIETIDSGKSTEIAGCWGNQDHLSPLVSDLLLTIAGGKQRSPSSTSPRVPHSSPTKRHAGDSPNKEDADKGEIFHLPINSNGVIQAYLSIYAGNSMRLETDDLKLLEELAHIASLIWTTIITSAPPRIAPQSPFDNEMVKVLDESGIALAVADGNGSVIFANDLAHSLAEGSYARRLEDLLPFELLEKLGVHNSPGKGELTKRAPTTLSAAKLWRENEQVYSLHYTIKRVMSSGDRALESQLVITVTDTSILTQLQHQTEHISELILTGTQAAPIAITVPRLETSRNVGSLASEIDLCDLYEEVFRRYVHNDNFSDATDYLELKNLNIEKDGRQLSLWVTFTSGSSSSPTHGVVLDTTEEMTAAANLRRSINVSDLQVEFAQACATVESYDDLDAAFTRLIQQLNPEVEQLHVEIAEGGVVKDTTTGDVLTFDHFALNTLNRAIRNLSVEEIVWSLPHETHPTPKHPYKEKRVLVVVPKDPSIQELSPKSQFYFITYPLSVSSDLHEHMLRVGNLYIHAQRRLSLVQTRARLGQTDPTTGLRVARALYEVLEKNQIHQVDPQKESWLLIVDVEDSDLLQASFGFDIHASLLCTLATAIGSVTGGHEVFRVARSTLASRIVVSSESQAQRIVAALRRQSHNTLTVEGILFVPNYKTSITRCAKELSPQELLAKALKDNLINTYGNNSKMSKSVVHSDRIKLSEVERTVSVLESGKFELHLQPKWSLKSDKPVSFEALLRWPEEDPDPIPTQHVISIVESLGLIDELTSQVMRQALPILSKIHAYDSRLTLAVNMSPSTLNSPKWLASQQRRLTGDVPLSGIIFEITESVALQSSQKVLYSLKELANLGTLYSIDDFGTGFTSLQNLTRLPLSELKIDISFIRSITTSKRSCSLVKAQIDIAHSLGIDAVAEGIEDLGQLQRVKKLGCDIVQGYLIARPFPARKVIKWLQAHENVSLKTDTIKRNLDDQMH